MYIYTYIYTYMRIHLPVIVPEARKDDEEATAAKKGLRINIYLYTHICKHIYLLRQRKRGTTTKRQQPPTMYANIFLHVYIYMHIYIPANAECERDDDEEAASTNKVCEHIFACIHIYTHIYTSKSRM